MFSHYLSAILSPASENIPKASADSILAGTIDGGFLLAGMLGVVGIVLSGFRYVTSNGDAGQVSKAKQGLLYSVIGLVVVSVAFGLVRFVMAMITTG